MLQYMLEYLHPHYIGLIFRKPKDFIYRFAGYCKAKYWRVTIGKGCRFSGFPIFRNLPDSDIIIGDGCQFNSSHSSNLIGIYTPCMISTIKRGALISIGTKCGMSGTVIAAAEKIVIGNNVRLGANTLITDTDWHSDDYRSRDDSPVIIGDNVWIGYGVKVLKGVTIGNNALVGAGSIVTHDIPANTIAAGNPCKVIKEIKNAK